MASAIMTPLGLAALKSREGVRLRAYQDSVGVWTIGYGHIKGVQRGQVITQAQADAFFLDDLATHALPILSCIKVPVADHERDALISVAFNIGVGGFQGSTFLKRLNVGDRAGCAAAIMFWTKNPELVTRRNAEQKQFLTPYSVSAPKARSNDARPVTADVFVAAPAVPTISIEVAPLPAPPAVPVTPLGPTVKTGSVGGWLATKLSHLWNS